MINVRTNNLGPNSAIITTPEGIDYLISYDTIIVQRTKNREITLDENYWDYSKTTGKHRNNFLCEDKTQTQRKIDNGVYQLANLNI